MSWWQDLLISLGVKPPPLTWLPTYEPQAFISQTANDGSVIAYPINIYDRVTADTAEHLRVFYAPLGTVELIPFLGPGGPVSGNPTIRWIRWSNGVHIIAG